MTGGGIFGGGSSKQTTTNSSEPWPGAQPTLNMGLSHANAVGADPSLWQAYTGSTVVPRAWQTQEAMNSLQGTIGTNLGPNGLTSQYQSAINNGGFNAPQMDAVNNARTLANSTYSVSPELQAVLDQNGAKMGDAVNLSASAAGRYGSGSHQGVLASSIGEMRNNAILSDYQNFLGRKDAANSNLFSMGQQGFGNLGTAYTGIKAPAQDLMAIGSMDEDLAKRQMDDQLRIFNEQQNLPKQRAEWLNAIGSGAGSLGGTTRSTQPGQNPFLQALGYGTSALGLLGGF